MSEEQTEQKYGKEGVEQSQGYQNMLPADPVNKPDTLTPQDLADDDSAAQRRLSRPPEADFGELVDRPYQDVQSGRPTPENKVVSVEQAAHDLTSVRAAEKLELEKQHNSDLNEALDFLAQEQAAQRAAQTPHVEQQPQYDAEAIAAMDPEQQNAVYAANQAQLAEADRQIQQLLQDPVVRERIEGEFNQVKAQVDQAKAAYQQATADLATQAQGVLTALFPDLSNLSGPRLQGALQYMQQSAPERFQQFQQLSGRAAQLVGVYRQQQAEQQQQMREVQAAQFKQFALVADDAFDRMNANVPAETRKAISREAVNIFKEFGISETELMQHYNSNPLLRSAAGQQIVAEAARWRLAQRNVATKVHHQVPHIARPGSSAEAQTRTEEALASARAKLKPSMSAKEAAAYVIARRAASR
jgi:hypothetical protein